MRDVLTTLATWVDADVPAALGIVTRVNRSAPRQPGSAMARAATGAIAGSVTGGCVEPDVVAHADRVLAGEPAHLVPYGIADEDAFEVGLPCGGEVDVFVESMDPALIRRLSQEVAAERPVAYVTVIAGPGVGARRVVVPGDDPSDPLVAAALGPLRWGDTGVVEVGEDTLLVHAMAPRPAMYVFGAIDHAAAVASMGRFLGYRVTVCDAREAFLTPERFPAADELVCEWPHRFLGSAPVDHRTAICVLTHDAKFDVPALRVAVDGPAGYIGAMGSKRTTERRRARLVQEGVTEEQLARIHAPIGLSIGARTPEEVGIAVAAEIVRTFRQAPVAADEARAHV